MPRRHRFILTTVAFALVSLTAAAASARADQIYFNNFNSGTAGSEWSRTTVSRSANRQQTFLGRFNNHSVNLNLATLPTHSSVTVSFDLYIIKSWNGNGDWGKGPDTWRFTADNSVLLNTTFSNGRATQAFSGLSLFGGGGGVTTAARTGAMANDTLGYGRGVFGDSIYSLSFTFSHANPSLTLNFAGSGLEGMGNESWGLDNVRVILNNAPDRAAISAPEPATMLLLGTGLAGVAARVRRRRRQS